MLLVVVALCFLHIPNNQIFTLYYPFIFFVSYKISYLHFTFFSWKPIIRILNEWKRIKKRQIVFIWYYLFPGILWKSNYAKPSNEWFKRCNSFTRFLFPSFPLILVFHSVCLLIMVGTPRWHCSGNQTMGRSNELFKHMQ